MAKKDKHPKPKTTPKSRKAKARSRAEERSCKKFLNKKMLMIAGGGTAARAAGASAAGTYFFFFSGSSDKRARWPRHAGVPLDAAQGRVLRHARHHRQYSDRRRHARLSEALACRSNWTTTEEKTGIQALMPRIVDQFQGYLRELRIDDLKGSAGVLRLKEELLRRVNVAAAPYRVRDVLLKEMIVQ